MTIFCFLIGSYPVKLPPSFLIPWRDHEEMFEELAACSRNAMSQDRETGKTSALGARITKETMTEKIKQQETPADQIPTAC